MPTHPTLARLLEPPSLEQVALAFSGVHPERPQYHWVAEASIQGETIAVAGKVFYRDKEVGNFKRQLHFARQYRRVNHVKMEIAKAHRKKRIAFYHYVNAFRFYEANAIRTVHLDADGLGPTRWPQFAFDLQKRQHKEMLHRILRHNGVPGLPASPMELTAYNVAFTKRGRSPIGLEALQALGERVRDLNQTLPMVLDLSDKSQRNLLFERGILCIPT